MNIEDFKGLTKYKIVLPSVYICTWICMIIGPIFFQSVYMKICVSIVIYSDLKIISMTIIMIYITIKTKDIFKRLEKGLSPFEETEERRQQIAICNGICYAFILPNFKEELQMMVETLNVIASHKRAKNQYLVFLAMEAHQKGCQIKAQKLIEMFKQKFRLIDFTRHEIREFEQKGKASNVSWCVEHLEPVFEKNMIDPNQVILTILDADSWAPDLYIDIMEDELMKNYQNRHLLMFHPPQIFCRNNLEVPVFTRVQDIMHSYLQCANLFSFFDLTFPISNYSASYALMKRIGFWDTCADAIGEDFHTTQKAFWKTNGELITIPIYAPFNQVNISTGKGYTQDILARFWQSERHAQGCSDMAWNFKMFFNTKFRPMNLVLFFQVLETFMTPAILPFIFITLAFQTYILYFGRVQPDEIIPPYVLPIVLNVISVLTALSYFNFEYFRRRSNKLIYKKENDSLFRVLEYPIIVAVVSFLVLTPTFILAAFMSLTKNRQYIVAQKKNTNTKPEQVKT